jgi:hypothetical protein
MAGRGNGTYLESDAMSSPSTKRTRAQPQRFIGLILAPFGGNPGVVRITVGKEVNDYLLQSLPSDFGRAFRLTKQEEDGESYDVMLSGEHSSCECKGWLRWKRCKHRDSLQALRQRGLI